MAPPLAGVPTGACQAQPPTAQTHRGGRGKNFSPVPSVVKFMPQPVRQFAVLCSLLLALPSGWCCMLGMSVDGAARAGLAHHDRLPGELPGPVSPQPKSCCHRAATPQLPASGTDGCPHGPTSPNSSCGCTPEAVVLVKSVSVDELSAVAPMALLPADLLAAIDPHGQSIQHAAPPLLLFASGPSLHVLQCVWLC